MYMAVYMIASHKISYFLLTSEVILYVALIP